MNKLLAALLERAASWPREAQDEAVRALAAIERRHVVAASAGDQGRDARLADLRATLDRSISDGGSFTDEEVGSYLDGLHAEAEREER
jgi:hypothetical protein